MPQRYTSLEHLPSSPQALGREVYRSSDGPIFIQQNGDVVIVTESFDEKTAERLIAAALSQVKAQEASSGSNGDAPGAQR